MTFKLEGNETRDQVSNAQLDYIWFYKIIFNFNCVLYEIFNYANI